MTTPYEMTYEEIGAVSIELADTLKELRCLIHDRQCAAISMTSVTAAARVELILQLDATSRAVERTMANQLHRINS